ncbi:prepilin peptidase [Candidatus Woesearchaeota archaeon]|nr:prepilin peptidase [Candidatus Woesearchaeota archaeon]
MLPLIITIIALVVLCIAAYTDLKTLEVPDWLNYAGIIAGMLIHAIFSVQQWNYWPVLSSLIGLGIAFALACLMFYTGQWGGGDAKLLMAMGALVGFEPNKFGIGASFLINLVFIGGAWGLAWTVYLATRQPRRVIRTCNALLHQKAYAQTTLIAVLAGIAALIAGISISFVRTEFFLIAALSIFLPLLVLFSKSVELVAMHHWVTPNKLTEGDWLVHHIEIGKTHITPPRLGLEKQHLAQLNELYAQKKIDKVLVKYGVPFTPAFLFAFLAALQWGNIILAALF